MLIISSRGFLNLGRKKFYKKIGQYKLDEGVSIYNVELGGGEGSKYLSNYIGVIRHRIEDVGHKILINHCCHLVRRILLLRVGLAKI